MHFVLKRSVRANLAQAFFGGVAAFSREQIVAVNGHSTEFWGWGKEGARGRAQVPHTMPHVKQTLKHVAIPLQTTTSGSVLQEQGDGLRSGVFTMRAWAPTALSTWHTSRAHL